MLVLANEVGTHHAFPSFIGYLIDDQAFTGEEIRRVLEKPGKWVDEFREFLKALEDEADEQEMRDLENLADENPHFPRDDWDV